MQVRPVVKVKKKKMLGEFNVAAKILVRFTVVFNSRMMHIYKKTSEHLIQAGGLDRNI